MTSTSWTCLVIKSSTETNLAWLCPKRASLNAHGALCTEPKAASALTAGRSWLLLVPNCRIALVARCTALNAKVETFLLPDSSVSMEQFDIHVGRHEPPYSTWQRAQQHEEAAGSFHKITAVCSCLPCLCYFCIRCHMYMCYTRLSACLHLVKYFALSC